jgi:hypothetical protein
MKELINIIKNKRFTTLMYSNNLLTVFLTGERYYEIEMDYTSTQLSFDKDANYGEGDCSISIYRIMSCDDLKESYKELKLNNVHELIELLEDNHWKEFE